MHGQRPIFTLLLTPALLAAVMAAAVPIAEAQNLRPALRDDDGPLPRIKPRAAPRPPARPVEPESVAEPQRQRPAEGDTTPDFDKIGADGEPEVAEAPTGVRPVLRDGEADIQLEPDSVTDGMAGAPDNYRNPDGHHPTQWDSRLPEDSGAFERPPAGYDAQAFGVELAPLDDRRPQTLFRFEPWQPRGIVIGSFTVFPQADIGAAWVSNLFRTQPARADQALELRPTLRAVSNWRTHAMELRATGALTAFDNYPKEGDRAYSIDARGRLDVTRRTQLTASVSRELVQEARGSLEARLRGTARPDVETNAARLQFDHRFNRLAVQLRGVAQHRSYEPVAAADGSIVDNRDRNLMTTEQAARASWMFKPTLSAFAEAGINQRRFEAASAVDGIKRNSDGERYRAGVSFGNTGQVLRGEASIGYGRQTPLDHRLQSIDGVIVDANLAWRVTPLTAVLLRASTDVVETTSLSSSGGFARRAQAEVRHAFLRPLIGTASAGFSATSYDGILINEDLTELALGLEYYLGPEAVLYGRYMHQTFRTNALRGDWDSDEVRIGMRIRR